MITFTINRNNFLESIQNIIGVVERRSSSSNQILSHVLIEASDGQIVFTSTDLEVQMTSETTIREKELSFSVTAPAKKLFEIARSLDDENISITIEDEGLAINSSSSNFKLKTLPAKARHARPRDMLNPIDYPAPIVDHKAARQRALDVDPDSP